MAVSAVVLCVVAPQSAWAVQAPVASGVIIVELQTGSLATGTEEFVELYNASGETVDVTDWVLQYRPATAAGNWTTKRKIACEPVVAGCRVELVASSRLVIASYDIAAIAGEQPMSGGFADSGGHVRLVNLGATTATTDDVVSDILGYGAAATEAEGAQPTSAPPASKSLKRLVSEDGYFVDTNVNANDFLVGCDAPTPGELEQPLPVSPIDCQEDPVEEPNPSDPEETPDPTDIPPGSDPTEQPGQGSGPITYLPVNITELLPDPESPAEDTTDEFIELFNPNTEAVNLKGYQLQSGTNYRYKYILPEVLIGPGQYLVVTSGESGLSLSNSGTMVRVLDPNDQVLDELANYGKSVAGQSWSKSEDGIWRWSVSPTPGQVNLVTLPPVKAAKTATAKKAATKTTAKPKVAAANKTSSTTAAEDAFEEPPAPPPNYWLLAGVGSMALGYGLYEYRQGIGQGLRKVWLAARGKNAAD